MTELEVGLTVVQVGSVPASIWAAAKLVTAMGHAVAEVMLARKGIAVPHGAGPSTLLVKGPRADNQQATS